LETGTARSRNRQLIREGINRQRGEGHFCDSVSLNPESRPRR
jgi:hypothetical protein